MSYARLVVPRAAKLRTFYSLCGFRYYCLRVSYTDCLNRLRFKPSIEDVAEIYPTASYRIYESPAHSPGLLHDSSLTMADQDDTVAPTVPIQMQNDSREIRELTPEFENLSCRILDLLHHMNRSFDRMLHQMDEILDDADQIRHGQSRNRRRLRRVDSGFAQ